MFVERAKEVGETLNKKSSNTDNWVSPKTQHTFQHLSPFYIIN
jgi:hypothetical protein